MTKLITAVLMFGIVYGAAAQTPVKTPTPAPVVETLLPSSIDTIAINAIRQEFKKAWADLADLSTDIAKEHPGYHFNKDTGNIEKDAPVPEGKK